MCGEKEQTQFWITATHNVYIHSCMENQLLKYIHHSVVTFTKQIFFKKKKNQQDF